MAKEIVQYAGFWKRFLAITIDVSIVYLILGFFYEIPLNPISVIILAILDVGLYLFYSVLMLGFFGRTIGMMISKIKVKKLDLNDIQWKEAFLRYLVNFVQATGMFIFMAYFILNAKESQFAEKDFGHFIVGLQKVNSKLNTVVVLNVFITWIWTWSEVVVLLMNEKKRAIHDFIAGTVVVKISSKQTV